MYDAMIWYDLYNFDTYDTKFFVQYIYHIKIIVKVYLCFTFWNWFMFYLLFEFLVSF